MNGASDGEARSRARQLRERGSYSEALPLFEELWQSADERTAWDGWGAAFCLRKLSRPLEAADYCREIEALDPDFEPAYSLHEWCLYDARLRDPAGSSPRQLLDVLHEIAQCAARSDPYGQYSALTRSTFKVISALRDPMRPYEILAALQYLDPTRLSQSPETIELDGKKRSLPSPRERYYQALTKALWAVERWRACADACVIAIESVDQFTGDGLMWVQRRLALAILNDGDAERAASLLRDLVGRLNGWFLLDDLAQAEISLGQLEEARDHLRQALSAPGPIEMKVSAIRRMAHVAEELGDPESACLHARLGLAVRTQHQWSADAELVELVSRLTCKPPPRNPSDLIAQARAEWTAGNGRETGTVATILPNGRAGFVKPASGGDDLYFQMRDFNGPSQLEIGLSVTYVAREGFDRKKNRRSTIAIEIELSDTL